MTVQLSPASHPYLTKRATVSEAGRGLIGIETEQILVVVDGSPKWKLVEELRCLDGRTAIREWSGPLRSEQWVELLNPLTRHRLLLDTTAMEDANGVEASLAAYEHECSFWGQDLVGLRFWDVLASGQAPLSVLFGWTIEFQHYVAAAHEHMALAVADCCLGTGAQHWLADHYLEEVDHEEIFKAGLIEDGIGRDAILSAPPLPATSSMIAYLNELAMSDTLAYTATFGIMQQIGQVRTPTLIRSFFEALSMTYPAASGAIGGFRRHALLDSDLDHADLIFERIVRDRNCIDREEARRCARAVRGLSSHFVAFFKNVLHAYGRSDLFLPRRPLDVRGLIRQRS